MTWILPLGETLQMEELSSPIQIRRALGGGTQGQVFAVEVDGEALALKWYLPACLARDPQLARRLSDSIRATAPNQDFLWPIALLHPSAASRAQIRCRDTGFGYLMDLRPADYVGAHEHVAGRIEISLRSVLRACFFLADAFHALHLRGLCYKDISLGNLFLQPGSGRILICDNDNVDVDGRDPGSVLGTPGFMAPEVLLGQARPGADSDLFSLAVLIFRLLTRHDPLRGQRELAIRCLDEPARRRLYGEDPLFIFDPADPSNRPDPIEHTAALITWPIYPERLKDLFEQTFCRGLRQPSQRALTGQWRRALSITLDQRQLCRACGQEVFPDDQSARTCWSCGSPLQPVLRLQLAHGEVIAAPDNELHPHHFDALVPESLLTPLARVEAHPGDPSIVGLRNLSPELWSVELLNGAVVPLQPQKTCNLAPVRRLTTPAGAITVLR
ncbi:protein kinase domain-containing protein [Synechococcus sp. CCY9202]|uniref:protein kinase domain-containing protein n=1 Tax=Synechococcus sp. CCY9202 TaxID=174698 RepID=UPI002B1F7038|nr:protein kinase [Synechococcus sp. CCY9202]MEA5421585.1 protein kinase [Synechococcus sp. CCY9202]